MSNLKQEKINFVRALLQRIINYPPCIQSSSITATDDEVRAFIRIFMIPNYGRRSNRSISSYGLKHVAERTIGYLFHGSDVYAYVSNDQFKRIMHEDEFEFKYSPKAVDESDVNEYYSFHWAPLADLVLTAVGAQSMEQPQLLVKPRISDAPMSLEELYTLVDKCRDEEI